MLAPSWFASIDAYCERTDPSFWSEPLNAASNGAFLIGAALALRLWRRAGAGDWPALVFIALAAVVGVGSFLFHTFANRWSALADVLPIAAFIYSYFFLAMRRFIGFGLTAAMASTLLFAAFHLGFDRVWAAVFGAVTLNGSVGYLPAALALVGVGGVLRRMGGWRARVGRELMLAAAIFALSLTFRSVDNALCDVLPTGTHFVWHILNGLLLFVLIRTAIGTDRIHSGGGEWDRRPV